MGDGDAMTTRNNEDDDESDGRGCAFFIGAVMIAIAVGSLTQAANGFLVLGSFIVFAALYGG